MMAALQLDQSGNPAVDAAARYIGRGYVYGGAPADGLGNWDCSSFANWVFGHDLKLAIPGYAAGTYTGAEHGPDTVEWATWKGAVTVSAAQAQPGNVVIWVGAGTGGHMGIVTGPDQMISALDPQQGTQETQIQGVGPSGVPLIYRSVSGAPAAAGGGQSPQPSGCAMLFIPFLWPLLLAARKGHAGGVNTDQR